MLRKLWVCVERFLFVCGVRVWDSRVQEFTVAEFGFESSRDLLGLLKVVVSTRL